LKVSKDREAVSAGSFFLPGQFSGVGMAASVMRPRRRVTTRESALLDTRRPVQLTAGVLSEKIRVCWRVRSVRPSRTSIMRTMAAISRSPLVRTPNLKRRRTSGGQQTRQTAGRNTSPNHMPPAPSDDASAVPAAECVRRTSSYT
jgi:hypothetical protein